MARTGLYLADIDLGIQPGGARMMRFRVLVLMVLVMACVTQVQADRNLSILASS